MLMKRMVLLVLLVVVGFSAPMVFGADAAGRLQAVGDSHGLWVVRQGDGLTSENGTFKVWRRWSGSGEGIEPVGGATQGVVRLGGIASSGDGLWLVLQASDAEKSGGSVQRLTVLRSPDPRQGLAAKMTLMGALPGGVSLRSMAGVDGELWALLRVEAARTLAGIDEGVESGDKHGRFRPVDRLLRLSAGQWVREPLPEGWDDSQRGWLIVGHPMGVLLGSYDVERGRLALWRRGGGGWQVVADMAVKTDIAPVVVGGQLMVGERLAVSSQAAFEMQVIRLGSGKVFEVGTLALQAAEDTRWQVVGVGDAAALLVAEPGKGLRWRRINLLGQVNGDDATQLTGKRREAWTGVMRYVVLTAVLAGAMVVMFVFWKRDQLAEGLKLPHELMLSDIGRRIAAGLIDLLPCVFLMSLVSGVGMNELIFRWLFPSQEWEGMWPSLVGIGLFVLHSGLSELFTGTSLGKKLMGMKVVGMHGEAAHLWQVLARNLFKVFELVLPLLLMFVILGPYRQRLGDLVGQTVVVVKRHEE